MEFAVPSLIHRTIVQAFVRLMRGTKAAVIEQRRQPTTLITYWKGTVMSQSTAHSAHHVQHPAHSSQVPKQPAPNNARSACDADIAKRAYEKYQARGSAHGFDRKDWAAASHELIAETFGHSGLSQSRALTALPASNQFLGA